MKKPTALLLLWLAWSAGSAVAQVTNYSNVSGVASTNSATATALAASPTQCSTNQYASGITATGNANCAQVSAGQVSGLAPSAATDTTNASNITNGTLPAGQMPLGLTAAPAAGQVPVGNSGGTAYAASTVSGDGTLAATGALTVTKTNGAAFGTFATQNYATPPAIGGTTPAAGAFSTLSASSAVSGAGFASYLASPPAIGGTAPAAITGTTVTPTTNYVHGVTILCQVFISSPTAGGNGIAAAHTGDSSEFNLASCAIPAGIMGTQGMLEIIPLWYRNATTTDTTTLAVRISTSQGATSGGEVSSWADATSGSLSGTTCHVIRNTTASTQIVAFGTAANTCFGTSAAAPVASTISTGSLQYANFNCTNTTSTSDSCGLYGYTVRLWTP